MRHFLHLRLTIFTHGLEAEKSINEIYDTDVELVKSTLNFASPPLISDVVESASYSSCYWTNRTGNI